MNYLTIGDPHQRTDDLSTVRIFDRDNCIAGLEFHDGGTIKYLWNNVDVNSISFSQQRGADGGWYYFLNLSGGQNAVMEFDLHDEWLRLLFSMSGYSNGSFRSISMMLGRVDEIDNSRVERAINLLFSEHCTGLDVKSAF